MNSRLRVFICHIHEDKLHARELYHWLGWNGFKPWLDEYCLMPGAEWEAAIREEIGSTDVFLTLISEISSSKRGFAKTEIRTALREAEKIPFGESFIFPVIVDKCEIPSPLSGYHAVDITSGHGREMLLAALNEKAASSGRAVSTERFFQTRAADALKYVLAHDDGGGLESLDDADVILIGLSRSCKSPLALYLAVHYGARVANYPIVEEDIDSLTIPHEILRNIDRVVALVVPPETLAVRRKVRRSQGMYSTKKQCALECEGLEKIVDKFDVLTVDASVGSIEELATAVLDQASVPERMRQNE